MSDFSDDNLDAQAEDALAHFGVMGMKWGKRSVGKGQTLGSSIASDRNQRKTALANRLLETGKTGKPTYGLKGHRNKSGLTKTDVMFRVPSIRIALGKKHMVKVANKQLKSLAAEKKRIDSGQMTVKDKLKNVMTMQVSDLYSSRRAS